MLPEAGLLVLSLGLAALVGFASAEGGTCAVQAVKDVLDGRGFGVSLSILKCSAWAAVLLLPLGWATPGGLPDTALSVTWPAAAGGLVFGIGAVLNGGCTFSTVWRLGGGDIAKVFALPGIALGLAAYLHWVAALLPVALASSAPLATPRIWSIILFGGVFTWAMREAVQLLSVKRGPRLDRAVAGLALGGVALRAIHGRWDFTAGLEEGVEWASGLGGMPGLLPGLLLLASLAGATIAARRKGTLRLTRPTLRSAAGSLGGGFLMGAGAALVPGGNDALVLHSLPSLLPHAFVAYAALVAGAAGTLLTLRR